MTESTDTPRRRRLWIVWAIVAIVVLVAGGVLVWQLTRAAVPVNSAPTSTSEESEGPTPDPTPAETLTPGPTPTAQPTPLPTDGPIPPELDPVAPDEEAENADVRVSLAKVESVNGQAQLSGEISGPAIRVTVQISNDGDEPLDLGYATVNAYYGADRTPAGTVAQPDGAPFQGALAPGESATGVYLFSIAPGDRGAVTLTVDYRAGEPTAVFVGDFR